MAARVRRQRSHIWEMLAENALTGNAAVGTNDRVRPAPFHSVRSGRPRGPEGTAMKRTNGYSVGVKSAALKIQTLAAKLVTNNPTQLGSV